MKDLQTLTPRRVKKFFAAHHYIYHTVDIDVISEIVNVKRDTVKQWLRQPNWQEYLAFWGRTPKAERNIGDLADVEKLWEQMIQDDTHTFSPELQDLYIDEKHQERIADPTYALQPYTVEGLSEDQIRERIAEFRHHERSNQRKYAGEHMLVPRWWLFPNYAAGIFSQVFAKANIVNHLICGSGEDAHLVCISDRLTISQNFADCVAFASDARLLVCL